MTPLPIHLTRGPLGSYQAASPEIRGVAVGTPTREGTLASVERTFRPWAGERGIEVVDLTGDA